MTYEPADFFFTYFLNLDLLNLTVRDSRGWQLNLAFGQFFQPTYWPKLHVHPYYCHQDQPLLHSSKFSWFKTKISFILLKDFVCYSSTLQHTLPFFLSHFWYIYQYSSISNVNHANLLNVLTTYIPASPACKNPILLS